MLDVGSGHNPHPRANILVDRFLLDDLERSGQPISLPEGIPFIVADASALPFKTKSFDFLICSHVAEHIDASDVEAFCKEMNRVTQSGYIETPSPIAEYLRHSKPHRWFVSNKKGTLVFNPIKSHNLLGFVGKFIRSIMFYNTSHAHGGYQDVYSFAKGMPKPLHYGFVLGRKIIYTIWRSLKTVFYTRFHWREQFDWRIES